MNPLNDDGQRESERDKAPLAVFSSQPFETVKMADKSSQIKACITNMN